MKILVVGGAGYLGGALTDIFLENKNTFRVYDSLLYEENYLKSVDFINGDVMDKNKLKKHLRWADVVIWLAAIVGDKACLVDPEQTYEINSRSVKWLTENFDKKIIFTSTCSVYGAKNGIVDENEEPNPISIYAGTKVIAEKYLKERPNTTIFRIGTLFGVSDTYSRIRMDLVVNSLSAQAVMYNTISVFGGKQYRPVLHVRDAARIIAESVKQNKTGVYNISQENITLEELSQKIKKQVPRVRIKKQKLVNDFRTYRVDASKAVKVFKIKPKLSVNDGIREIIELLNNGRIKNFLEPRYYNHLYLEKMREENG